ncbi:hypothetical protein ACSFCK_00810 [Brevibacterium luteolum]|uniref:hypothetical protein n=1 Tax=Brevibacterium luteolum TaxID=199591 RepID=UPI003EEE8D24
MRAATGAAGGFDDGADGLVFSFLRPGAEEAGVLPAAMAVSLVWRFSGQPFGIHEILPGLITSAIVLIAVSLATRHSDDEVVVAYYHAYRAGELRTHGVDEEPAAAGDVPAGTSTAAGPATAPAARQATAPEAEVAAGTQPARTAEAASPGVEQQRPQAE